MELVAQADVTPERLVLLCGWYFVFLFSTVLHEGAHALAAWKLGDPTAYYGGQVTLNPLPHIERAPFGTVVVPLVSYLWFGWMMGWAHAPYDPRWALRYPQRAALMALAGPMANLLLAALAFVILRVGLVQGFFAVPEFGDQRLDQWVVAKDEGLAVGAARLASILFTLNLILLIFNLLPFPPLDGSAILQFGMRRETAARYQEYLRHPVFPLVGLLIAWKAFPPVLGAVLGYTLPWLYGSEF
jgi:Zn-dependent protease